MNFCQTALTLSIISLMWCVPAFADTPKSAATTNSTEPSPAPAVAPTAVSKAMADECKTQIAKGDELLLSDQTAKAIDSYTAAVKANPQSSAAHQRLGHALSLTGNLQSALDEERTALNIDPNNGEAHCNMGWIFGLQQRFRAAVEEEKLAIAIDPNNGSAYSILGLSLASLEDYDLAISAFNKAIALDPNDFNSCMNLGAALGRKKDYAGAISMYKRALNLNQSNPNAYLGLGAALGKKGDLQGQAEAYKHAVALAPNNPANHGRLGYALSQMGDWRSALREGSIANGLRMQKSSTDFFKMFLTTWAAIFVVFGALFTVVFSGSRFRPQPGEQLLKSFFLTFYKDKPGRFVLTTRRLVFVPEAFSTWFGSTRVSMELDQVTEVESHSTMSGGRLSILSSNGSVHQFSMPNLVLEPLTKQLKELAATHKATLDESAKPTADELTANILNSMNIPDLAPQLSFDPFANNIDDKDAVIITVVSNDTVSPEQTLAESNEKPNE
ncbi:MAG: tetratricopeptide repeat protein [Cyanobacteria bacterium SZAS-4]|nr:tetratricopeptide repeat protein [Cyanobacteria bacterium SZAS-4]